MKKLKKLSLNKDVISKLDASKVMGGGPPPAGDTNVFCVSVTTTCDGGGGTTVSQNCTTGPAPTAAAGCTRETVELSFCNGLGLPAGCQSVEVCA